MNLKLALIFVLIIVVIYVWWPSQKSSFTLSQKVRSEAKKYLDQSAGKMKYSDLKTHIPEIDNTVYPDLLEMWRNNDL